jgi:hypothetical protein
MEGSFMLIILQDIYPPKSQLNFNEGLNMPPWVLRIFKEKPTGNLRTYKCPEYSITSD